MIKYSSIVKLENKKTESSFQCNICNLRKNEDIWMKYIINETEINICSYKCSNIFFKNRPFKLDNVVNRKDFDLPRPVTCVCKDNFEILSEEEIEKLSDREYIRYNKDLRNYIKLNPEKSNLFDDDY